MRTPCGMDSREPHGLNSLRIWIPSVIALFVILGSVGLVFVFEHQQKMDEREAFSELARVNAGFMERTRLPRTEQMASRLGEVIGADVYFRDSSTDTIVGPQNVPLPDGVFEWAVDGEVAELSDGRLIVGFTDQVGIDMIFIRNPVLAGASDLSREAWWALGIFWFLTLVLGLSMSLWVSSPLQGLVRALPMIGTDDNLPKLPTNRRDEIGLLARVLDETHQSLSNEREKRRQAERLALLGRMATAIAHEIRNPAAAIRLHAELLDASDAAELAKSKGYILDESKRLENLVSQWMHFSRPEPPKTSDTDLLDLLRDVIAVMEPQAAHMGVTLQMDDPGHKMYQLKADRHRLHQVFSNLVLNAVQAMPGGGRVKLKLLKGAKTFSVFVSDEGNGFSQMALEMAQKPFFSEREGGLGLGLAVANDICRAHGGNLEASNLEEGGACIRVDLPIPQDQDMSPS